jgi:hypothetical protein
MKGYKTQSPRPRIRKSHIFVKEKESRSRDGLFVSTFLGWVYREEVEDEGDDDG